MLVSMKSMRSVFDVPFSWVVVFFNFRSFFWLLVSLI